ncbi:MAG TPA: hypothetical protein VH044_12590 [Polyangiaceae bacterium]|jgi:hypothetical protein|nr:hypothetical protein [Polyangiaceae bacterium]
MPLKTHRKTITSSFAAALACAMLSGGTASAAEPTKDQCIDANEQAQGLRKNDKLREAEQKLLVCVSTSCPGPVREDCGQRLTEVRAITPTLVFVVKDDADQDLSDVRVTMDDQVLASKLDGTAIAVNPGPHHFVFEAPGRAKEERSLVVREGEKDRHERVVLVTLPAESVPLAAVPVTAPAASAAVESPPSPGRAQRIAGLAVAGVGVAGVVVGSVFGIVAKSTYKDALTGCTDGNTDECTHDSVQKSGTAHDQATVSTIAFIAGGALLAGGVALYFTAPHASVAIAPTVGMGSAGLGVSGSW